MPGFDGTGPARMGPITGWGLGYCNPYQGGYGPVPVFGPAYWGPGYYGRGFARGRGFGGRGSGFRRGFWPGFGRFRGFGRDPGWGRLCHAWGRW